MPSGTKLVVGVSCLALALGIVSWWYRYESAHRSTRFWGPAAADALARPDRVMGYVLRRSGAEPEQREHESLEVGHQVYVVVNRRDLTQARGIKHLDALLLNDRNFGWGQRVPLPDWNWALEFSSAAGQATVVFSQNCTVMGVLDPENHEVRMLACEPLAETLREYFARQDVFDASNSSE